MCVLALISCSIKRDPDSLLDQPEVTRLKSTFNHVEDKTWLFWMCIQKSRAHINRQSKHICQDPKAFEQQISWQARQVLEFRYLSEPLLEMTLKSSLLQDYLHQVVCVKDFSNVENQAHKFMHLNRWLIACLQGEVDFRNLYNIVIWEKLTSWLVSASF